MLSSTESAPLMVAPFRYVHRSATDEPSDGADKLGPGAPVGSDLRREAKGIYYGQTQTKSYFTAGRPWWRWR